MCIYTTVLSLIQNVKVLFCVLVQNVKVSARNKDDFNSLSLPELPTTSNNLIFLKSTKYFLNRFYFSPWELNSILLNLEKRRCNFIIIWLKPVTKS